MIGLFSHRSAPSPLCPICKNQEESVIHMLLRCPWVEPIWFGGQLCLRRVGDGVSSFNSWIQDMLNLASHQRERSRILSIIAFSCWHIWKARCNYVFNAITIVPSHVLHAISLSLVSFWEVQVPKSFISRSIIDSSRPDPRWCCPIALYIKINVDASWSSVSGRTNLATVLRDHEGQFVAAHKLSIVAPSVVFAEAMAVLNGCELAAEPGLG
ncbi:hypothetical protein ACFX2B_006202 [Malus domestica]